jgi:hypothetical protein
MKNYRVTIWTTVDVEADTPKEAEQLAHDDLINGEIKNSYFMVKAEETE